LRAIENSKGQSEISLKTNKSMLEEKYGTNYVVRY
jgi:hypothetical protein